MSRQFVEVAVGVFVSQSATDCTNSTVLVAGSEAVLVDPGWQPHELNGIADWLDEHELTVMAGFATHAHHDHLLWHPRFGTAPRWAGAEVAKIASEHRVELVEALGPDWPSELAALVGKVSPLVTRTLPWSGFAIELITHDAHAPGHTALWLPEQSTLLAGDMLSDLELPLAEQTGIQEYLAGLKALEPYVSRATVLIPGHGNPALESTATGSVSARLAADQSYWDDVLTTGDSQDPRSLVPAMAAAHQHHRALAAGWQDREIRLGGGTRVIASRRTESYSSSSSAIRSEFTPSSAGHR